MKLSPESTELLRSAMAGEDAGDEARARVRHALAAKLGAAVLATGTAAAVTAAASSAAGAGAIGGVATSAAGAGTAVGAGAGAAGVSAGAAAGVVAAGGATAAGGAAIVGSAGAMGAGAMGAGAGSIGTFASAGLLAKVIGAIALASAAGAVTVSTINPSDSRTDVKSGSQVTTVAQSQGSAPMGDRGVETSTREVRDVPAPRAHEPSIVSAAPREESPKAELPTSANANTKSGRKLNNPILDRVAEVAEPVPVVESNPRAPAPVPASTEGKPDTLPREVQLLTNANQALERGKPEEAIALLDRHQEEFPKGVLREEEIAQRVFALCKAGRADEARRLANQFLASHPHSTASERIRRSCN